MPPEQLETDRVERALGELPARDVDPWRREQIRRKAHAELLRQAELSRRPWLARLSVAYDRVLEPVFVASVSCAYLAWAFQQVSEILSR